MKNQDEMPLVSVIVAIYQSEPFLPKCIESILRQDYGNLEIILVDDGSPDGSGAICDQYALTDRRITVIHKQNGGTCEARNTGMGIATGDYLIIVDGDDWLADDCVSYLMGIVKEYDVDMAMTYNIFTTRDQTQIEDDCIRVLSSEDAVVTLLYPVMAVGPWNKIYKREMLLKNSLTFSVPWSGEGLYFATMAAQYAGQVGVGCRKVYNYRLNNSNSGLTKYKLEMGVNALQNIKTIKELLIVDTPRTRHAADWHIWKNYYYVFFLLIATDSENEHEDLAAECLGMIRKGLPSVLLHSEVGLKTKLGMIRKAVFPRWRANVEMRNAQEALKQDMTK